MRVAYFDCPSGAAGDMIMASLLAGDNIDYACCNTLRFAQLTTLKNQWESQGRGVARAVDEYLMGASALPAPGITLGILAAK